MRKPSRIYLLLGVASLLAWLNISTPATTQVAQLAARSTLAAQALDTSNPSNAADALPLPAELHRPPLEVASRDPFVVWAPPPVVTVKQAPVVPIVEAPPIPAAPPPHNLTFAGRMTAPDGTELVYVNQGDTSLALVAGQNLSNGYRVESITARAIELSYPPLNTTARLELPVPPKYEIR